MKAMILAAGDGVRMRPLTEDQPKPMLQAGGKPLLQYHIEALARAGLRDIVINHARLGRMIEDYFGSGERFGVHIHYSAEGETPLETGGGIRQALGLLDADRFLVINADIWTDYPVANLVKAEPPHLVLVPNPPHNPAGDFALQRGQIHNQGEPLYTFSGMALYKAAMFAGLPPGRSPLLPLLRQQVTTSRVTGELYQGHWFDIGTPDRLQALNVFLSRPSSSPATLS
ncbi:MAG: N-acetylmuramate alpha-1-phosphate uridylyltransferase MurU [Gammaproteobacteria bacterium]